VTRALAVTGIALVAAVAISSCGGGSSGGLIPQSTALNLNTDLQNIQAGVLAGDCSLTEQQVASARTDFDNIPSTVNGGLRIQLAEGFNALQLSAQRDCQSSAPTGGSTGTTGATAPTGTTSSTTSSTASSTASTTSSSTASSTATTTSTNSSAPTSTTGTTTTPGQTCTTAPSGGVVCTPTTSTTATNGLGGPANGGANSQ